uniref:Uncharacterized protein n=1 Tax=Ananas comosus var. bracteatus TaxID=296719 RepID=A0A6V7Q9N8_ANACO|nr:unnamed protein product [Ananas comosus var. bracteatus]
MTWLPASLSPISPCGSAARTMRCRESRRCKIWRGSLVHRLAPAFLSPSPPLSLSDLPAGPFLCSVHRNPLASPPPQPPSSSPPPPPPSTSSIPRATPLAAPPRFRPRRCPRTRIPGCRLTPTFSTTWRTWSSTPSTLSLALAPC